MKFSASTQPTTPVVKTVQQGDFIADFFINENVVRFHTKSILSTKVLRWDGVTSPKLEDSSPQLVHLVRSIESIPGIERIMRLEKYSISIIKAKAFSWKEILPRLEQALVDYSRGYSEQNEREG